MSSKNDEAKLQRFLLARLLKIAIPALMTVILFLLTIFIIVIPAMQKSLMEQKREKIRDVSSSVWSILESYERKERSGEMSRKEAQACAAAELSIIRYGSELKDYLWINDINCRMIAHPYTKDFVGRDVTNFRDSKGKLIFQEFVKAASGEKGCGYVEYMWQWNNSSGKIAPKVSFVRLFKPWGWVVGTGIYVDDVKAEIAAVTNRILMISVGILVIILIISLYMIFQGIEAETLRCNAEVAMRKARDELEIRVEERTAELKNTNSVLEQEIAERRKAEESLKESKQLLEKTIASIKSAIFILQGETMDILKIVNCNEAAESIFGYTISEMVGRSTSFLHVDEASRNELLVKVAGDIKEKGFCHVPEFNMKRKDGSVFPSERTLTPMVDNCGNLTGWVSVIRDITEKKKAETEQRKLESQLLQAQKLESIGQLAAGIAHEINTPIQYIGDNIRFLQSAFGDIEKLLRQYGEISEEMKKGVPVDELARTVESACQEADLDYLRDEIPRAVQQSLEGVICVRQIVAAMKEFSYPSQQEKIKVDINRAIENTVIVARNEWKYVADLVMDLDPSLPLISCLPGELNQAVLNMIVNAAHAIEEKADGESQQKGTITIKTRCNCKNAEIRISDTGAGIHENIRSRIFDPFFTTKDVGKGTGQGLAIAHSVIVGKHHGTIEFESETGKGTTFMITLPIDD
ncbi:MAG: cache domain-containing protein [Vulcanimicrobiota bacterium]